MTLSPVIATSPHPMLLRFGSLQGRLRCAQPEYFDGIATVFGAELLPFQLDGQDIRQFDLVMDGPSGQAEATPWPRRSAEGIRLGGTPRNPTITTAALHADLALDAKPVRIRLSVRRPDIPYVELCVYLGVVFHKLLALLGRVVLHAAAVELHGAVSVFVGEKGTGKSTVCLALARAGGTVLGEDRVILRRDGAGFLVSGGDERSRLTEPTERHFFSEPLPVAVRDFAGTLKKEIRLRDFFRSRPYEDSPARRLIFPRVTGRLALRRLKAQSALVRLMASNGHFQRFADRVDQERYLDLLAGFTASIPAYELDLSRDLHDLDGLADTLRDA